MAPKELREVIWHLPTLDNTRIETALALAGLKHVPQSDAGARQLIQSPPIRHLWIEAEKTEAVPTVVEGS